MVHDPKMIDKIKQAVGEPVSFRFPRSEGHKGGILKDRAVVVSNPYSRGVPYWDVVDLIEFPEEREPLWMRIGYYRKPKDRLNWAVKQQLQNPCLSGREFLSKQRGRNLGFAVFWKKLFGRSSQLTG